MPKQAYQYRLALSFCISVVLKKNRSSLMTKNYSTKTTNVQGQYKINFFLTLAKENKIINATKLKFISQHPSAL